MSNNYSLEVCQVSKGSSNKSLGMLARKHCRTSVTANTMNVMLTEGVIANNKLETSF